MQTLFKYTLECLYSFQADYANENSSFPVLYDKDIELFTYTPYLFIHVFNKMLFDNKSVNSTLENMKILTSEFCQENAINPDILLEKLINDAFHLIVSKFLHIDNN